MMPPLVIGVGNPDRGDDAVGLHVARALAADSRDDVEIVTCGGEATALAALWSGRRAVLVADAVVADADPGTVLRLDAHDGVLPQALFRGSTHALGLAEAVELTRALGDLPDRLLLFGIVGRSFDHGAPLSPAVADGAARAVAMLRADLALLREKNHA
ncbi:MAG: hydrogenase maturation protease [Inquilinaceae bacterium]